MAFTTQIAGLTKLSPELQVEARLGIHEGMELLGIEAARMVQDNIATPFNGRPAATDTLNLLNSIVSDVSEDAAITRLIVGVSQTAGADLYAGPVETGARPHMPPIEALIGWVTRKFDVADEKQATSIAWAVATNIKKRGTQGHEMFERALIDIEPMVVPVLERSIGARLLAVGGAA